MRQIFHFAYSFQDKKATSFFFLTSHEKKEKERKPSKTSKNTFKSQKDPNSNQTKK